MIADQIVAVGSGLLDDCKAAVVGGYFVVLDCAVS